MAEISPEHSSSGLAKIIGIALAVLVIFAIVLNISASAADSYCNCTGMATRFDRAPYTFWRGAGEWPLNAETPYVYDRDESLRCDSTYCGELCREPCSVPRASRAERLYFDQKCSEPCVDACPPMACGVKAVESCCRSAPCVELYDEPCGVGCCNDGGYQRLDATYALTLNTARDDYRDKMDGLVGCERPPAVKCCARPRSTLVSLASVNGGVAPPGAVRCGDRVLGEKLAPLSDFRFGGYGPCQNARAFVDDAAVGVL